MCCTALDCYRHMQLVGVINGDIYQKDVENVSVRRKKMIDLAEKAKELRYLKAAEEDLAKLEQENQQQEREVVVWSQRAAQLEVRVDKVLEKKVLHGEAKELQRDKRRSIRQGRGTRWHATQEYHGLSG